MREELIQQQVAMDYIACDLTEHETLADYRKRVACSRRRWWHMVRHN